MATIAAIFVSANSFTVSGNHTEHFEAGTALKLYQGVDGVDPTYVDSSSYSAGTGLTTCVTTESVVTSNLATVRVSEVVPAKVPLDALNDQLAASTLSATDVTNIQNIAPVLYTGASGDMFYRNGAGALVILEEPADLTKILGWAGGFPAWVDKGVTNGDDHDHIGGDGAAIAEGAISLSDVTTADASMDKHGLMPKLSNDPTKFFRGDGQQVYIGGGEGLYRNVIINGNFDIWQLATSFANCAHYQIVADRWVWGQSAGTATWTISADTDTPDTYTKNSLKIACTGADATLGATDETHIRYMVEGCDLKKLRGKTCTLSFWVKSSITGTFCIAFVGALGTDELGTNSYTQIKEYTINQADTWEQKTITIVFDYASDTNWNYDQLAGLKIRFTLRCGANNQTTSDTWNAGNFMGTSNQVDFASASSRNFYLSRVQLNEGAVQLPFAYRHWASEKRLCDRYLQVFWADTGGVNVCIGFAPSTGGANFDLPLRATMRIAPTVTAKGTIITDYDAQTVAGTGVSVTGLTSYARSKTHAKWTLDKTGGFTAGNPYQHRLVTTSGALVVSAEWGTP